MRLSLTTATILGLSARHGTGWHVTLALTCRHGILTLAVSPHNVTLAADLALSSEVPSLARLCQLLTQFGTFSYLLAIA